MEWREQTSVTCEDAFTEAQRWMEEVTNKSFGSNNFRSALENGVLLCHLINQLKPGLVKRMNTLPTPMAGLDNVNVFLRACGTLGLHEAQLFHPGDLQDLSTRATLRCVESKRRLKNVLITIYWLGRKAQVDPFYSGPQLNLKAFEGLLGIALSKALEETPRGSVKDFDYSDVSYPERDDELLPLTQSQPPGYSRQDSVESFNSVLSFDSAESRTRSCISDSILRAGSEDSSSDVEAENCFRMKAAEGRDSGQRNWGNVPASLQRKKREENRIKASMPSPLTSVAPPPPLSPPLPQLPDVKAFLQWAYHSGSDADRPQPDVVADDLASRRFRSLSPATPTNFSVPMSPQGTLRLWTGSPRLFRIDTHPRHTAVFSPSSSTASSPFPPNPFHDPPSSITLSEAERSLDEELLLMALSEEGREDPDPVKDDLYARRVELALHQTTSNPGYNRFLPRYWTPEEEVHVRTIRLGSQRRPWYHKMYRFRSKSLNDIRWFPSATQVVRQVSEGGMELSPSAVSQDQLQRGRVRVHESEAKWHNDLTKWKLRRHRSNCDLRRKMQERDNIVLMTNAGVVTGGTCRSLREDREEDEESLCGSSHNKVSTSAKEGSLELRPHTRAPLALGSSVESPYSSGASEPFTTPSLTLQAQGPSAGAVPQSEPLVLGERRHTPVEPDGAGGLATFPNSASPFSSHAQTISSPALVISTGRDQNISSLSNGIPTTLSGSGSCLTTSSSLTTSDLVNGTGSNLTSVASSHSPSASMDIPDQALLSTVESLTSLVAPAPGHVSAPQQQALPLYRYSSRAPGGRGGVSASLPRGYRRSEGSSSCLSAGFTPRPFGAMSCRVSSLPRLYNLENSLLNGNGSLLPTKTAPSRPQKMVTISEVAVRVQPWATANQSSVNQEVNEEGGSQTQPSILKARGGPGPTTHPKPSRKGPLPPSLLPTLPVSVRQNGSAQVRHSDRVCLTLKLNSRPHFGFNTHWDSTGARVGGIQPGSPAELCQLRAGDEIVSVGGHRVAEMTHSQWKGTMTYALQTGSLTMDVQRHGDNSPTDTSRDAAMVNLAQLNGQEVNGVTSKNMKGAFRDDPLAIRSKEHDLIVLKTQKRRAEFFHQKGGSASAISDLQVPSLSTSPSSWSWDPEEERRRQEKWQEEQECILQEKYRQDQKRLDVEWQQAQEEAGVEGYRQAEVTPDPLPSRGIVGNVVPCVKSSAPNTESSGEMTDGTASLASPQPVLGQPMPPVARVASNQKKEDVFDGGRREEPHPQEGRSLEEETDGLVEGDNWSGDSYGFTQLSIADRMKSKSFPSLEGFHRQEVKGGTGEVARRKPGQSMSVVEAERQQILEEMRKRTALLTDNSWIRQRSTSDNKQPTNRRGPMRRYDSLDNLPSSSLLSNPQRPHSSLGFSAPYHPPSSRHSMGGALGGYSNGTQKHSPTWPRPFSTSSTPPNTGEEPATGESRPVSQQHDRVLTSRQVCSVCVCPMGRGAAMVIETLNLCFHLACFQCVDCRCRLGGSEVRAQIRISNGKPYCDPCYIRLKSHLATSL